MFLLGIRIWTPALRFLTSSPGFVVLVYGGNDGLVRLQPPGQCPDGTEGGSLRTARESRVLGAKIALLVAFVEVSPHYGIFASWTAALVASWCR